MVRCNPTGAVRKIKQLIEEDILGDLLYTSSEGFFIFQKPNLDKNEFIRESREIEKSYHLFLTKIPLPFLRIIGILFYKHVG